MKLIFVIFASCLVAVNAGTIAEPSINIKSMIGEVLVEVANITKVAAVAIKHQVEQIILDPMLQVEAEVERIEGLREINNVCVAAEDENVVVVVDAMDESMADCVVVAAKSSAEVTIGITASIKKMVTDGYNLLRFYKKCKNHKIPLIRKSCFKILYLKATLYANSVRRNIKFLNKTITSHVPAIMEEANTCTHDSADIAICKLQNIHASIIDCMDGE